MEKRRQINTGHLHQGKGWDWTMGCLSNSIQRQKLMDFIKDHSMLSSMVKNFNYFFHIKLVSRNCTKSGTNSMCPLAGHGGSQQHKCSPWPDSSQQWSSGWWSWGNHCPLQCWCWENWNFHWTLQAHSGLFGWWSNIWILLIFKYVILQKVKILDPFETVLEMRKQRMKMVQKPMQYHYMIKCLADFVAEESTEVEYV